ncbi:MAG: DNA polymerase IV [Neisseria sp.]|nr:DNA polymerase IV [Neisseria sp.]
MSERKIIHIDMDAFYASVELRENSALRGQPLVVAYDGPRSVVCAASYEARRFGVRSALPLARAKVMCPQAVVIAPNFALYREVSAQIHRIFARYTDLIEPLSLDEAYLDVSANRLRLPSATETARRIRDDIFGETQLTASAGVAPNKFLAKIASDWRKPNGQFVIAPHQVADFLRQLPVEKIPGVGRSTLGKMHRLQVRTVGDLQQHEAAELTVLFGRYGYRLYEFARGIDRREVEAARERRQISVETTLAVDLRLPEIVKELPALCEDLWRQAARKHLFGQCVTLKLKTEHFRSVTRSQTFSSPPTSAAELLQAVGILVERVALPETLRYRLIGVGLSDLRSEVQQTLL